MNASDIPQWDKLPVEDRRVNLRGFFKNGDIKRAKRHELEDFLVLLAITPFTDHPADKEETERYVSVVQHLLQVRISEELHWRSMVAAGIAAVISALALLVAG